MLKVRKQHTEIKKRSEDGRNSKRNQFTPHEGTESLHQTHTVYTDIQEGSVECS